MKLTQLTTEDFTRALSDASPAPGGGSAAALAGAQGAALLGMVCALTKNSAQSSPRQPRAGEIEARAQALRLRLLELAEEDTQAFLSVSSAYAMKKNSEEERMARSAAIQKGLELCTRTPLSVMEQVACALELAQALLGGFNENAASDLGVAGLCLEAGLRGAWYNVQINVNALKDSARAESYRRRGEALLAEALPRAAMVAKAVQGLLQPAWT